VGAFEDRQHGKIWQGHRIGNPLRKDGGQRRMAAQASQPNQNIALLLLYFTF